MLALEHEQVICQATHLPPQRFGQECLTCLAFPEPHRRRIRTTNGPKRLNQELKRRTRVVRIFPNREACLRLMTALADLTLYTGWDASDITQMDYKWTILVP